jgi:hypothetical protein
MGQENRLFIHKAEIAGFQVTVLCAQFIKIFGNSDHSYRNDGLRLDIAALKRDKTAVLTQESRALLGGSSVQAGCQDLMVPSESTLQRGSISRSSCVELSGFHQVVSFHAV